MNANRTSRRWLQERKWLAPALATVVFFACLALTLGLVYWHARQNAVIAQQQLALAGNALVEQLSLRVHSFDNALIGLRGAMAHSPDRVASYRQFDRVVDLMQQYPGALSVGYAQRVSQANTPALLAQRSHQEGRTIVLHATHVNNGDRFIVVAASGSMALGTDLAAEAPVREAGMRATWLNAALLSPPVTTPSSLLPSLYLLLPVYADGSDPRQSMQRHESTVGWLFIHLSGERLMQGIADRNLQVTLFDIQADEEQTVLFETTRESTATDPRADVPTLQLERSIGGRTWRVMLTPNAGFQDSLGQLSPHVGLAGGALVSVLAALLSYALLVMQQRAVTLANHMTAALQASEKRQRAILENASVGIVFTSNQTTEHANRKAAELFGWDTPQAMLGLPGVAYWPTEEDYQDVGRIAGPALRTGGVFESERPMRRRDGSTFLARIRAKALDPAAPSTGTIWITEDVTEQRRMETLLKEGERKLSQIIDGSPIAIFVIDAQHQVTHWNSACAQLTGVPAASVIGTRDCWRGFYPDARPTMANLIVSGGSLQEIANHYGNDIIRSPLIPGAVAAEGFFTHMPPHGRWLHFMAAPVRDAEGRLIGAIETLNDMTERKEAQRLLAQRTDALQQANQELGDAMERLTRTQQELVRSEKLAAMGNMVIGVAHEMNTPIGVCLMAASTLYDNSQALQDELASGLRRTTLERFVQGCQSGTELLMDNLRRMAQLVNSFKRVAVRQTVSPRSRFDLAQIAAMVVDAARALPCASGIVINNQVPPGLALDSYPDEMQQVLISLVGNAVSHGLEGREQGRITIQAHRDEARECVVLTVSDDGKGMSPDMLPRIFDPFFTTKLGVGNSGLGLNICYNQVTGVLGGSIDVRSTVGIGTTFTLVIPLRAP